MKLNTHTKSDSNHYIQALTINEHKKYVNSVVVVYTLEEYPNGLILTGSNDKTIAMHNIESNEFLGSLDEHAGSGMTLSLAFIVASTIRLKLMCSFSFSSKVCSLYFDNNSKSNILYSGSFDSSAKVWNLNDLVKSDFKLKSSITIKG